MRRPIIFVTSSSIGPSAEGSVKHQILLCVNISSIGPSAVGTVGHPIILVVYRGSIIFLSANQSNCLSVAFVLCSITHEITIHADCLKDVWLQRDECKTGITA